MAQKEMAQLFDVSADNISLHLKNLYQKHELDAQATTEESSVVQKEGMREIKRKAKLFFKKVQNKMLWAITGQTAAVLILNRSDATKPNMGLTGWQGIIVRKIDVVTAKNYLQHHEIEQLNRIVVMYLDYAEEQALRRKTIILF